MIRGADNLRVVLVAPRNPLNIGAAARAMSNFGFLRLRVVNPYEVAFREARSAVGATQVLKDAEEYHQLADAIADCLLVVGTTSVSHHALKLPLYHLEYGAQQIKQALLSGPVALLFGSEKFGLTNEDLSYCHWLMRIPTRVEHPSMNLGQAVAVCLYELVRSESRAQHVPQQKKPATQEQISRFTEVLLDLLWRSGYINPVVSTSTVQKIRRLVLRLNLMAEDIPVWLGILKQIKWKLDTLEGELQKLRVTKNSFSGLA